MAECSNPVSCQTAVREECRCECQGINHGKLRQLLDSNIPEIKLDGEEKLKELKFVQIQLKKVKRIERRKKRAEVRKAKVTS